MKYSRFFFPWAVALAMSLGLAASWGAPETEPRETELIRKISVGGRWINIPRPEGMVRVDGIYPKWDDGIKFTQAKSYRLLANYGETETLASLRQQVDPFYEKNCRLTVTRELENSEIGEKEFAIIRENGLKGLEKMKVSMEVEMARVSDKVNGKLGVDTATGEKKFEIGNPSPPELFLNTKGAIGFSTRLVRRVAQIEDSKVVSWVMSEVNGRLLYFYSTVPPD